MLEIIMFLGGAIFGASFISLLLIACGELDDVIEDDCNFTME